MSSDSDVDGYFDPPGANGQAEAPVRRQVRRRGPMLFGSTSCVFLLIASLAGWWPQLSSDPGSNLQAGDTFLSGAVVAHWMFVTTSDALRHPHAEFFKVAARQTQGEVLGFLAWIVDHSVRTDSHDFDGTCSHDELIQQCSRVHCGDVALSEQLYQWRVSQAYVGHVTPLWISCQLAGHA